MSKLDQPATKGDLANLESRLETKIDKIEHRLETKLEKLEHCIDDKLDAFKDEILRHFDIIAENLRHDALGARSDEIEVLKDSKKDHERRLTRLEQSAGLIVA